MLPSDSTLGDDTVLVYADLPSRLVAFVIDVVVVSVIVFAGAIVVSVIFGPVAQLHPDADSLADRVDLDAGRAAIDIVMAVLVSGVYFVGSWVRWGATPGQRIIGARVLTPAGENLTLGRAALRWLVLIAPLSVVGIVGGPSPIAGFIVLVLTGIWYAAIAMTTARDGAKRGIHDSLTGAVVTKPARIAG